MCNLKKWKRDRKERMVKAMGGKCVVCGYNKSMRALCFHYLDPNKKDKSFNITKTISWERTVKELKLCVLLCSNCHFEIHEGIIKLPKLVSCFNEAYDDYTLMKYNKEPSKTTIDRFGFNWKNIDLINELKKKSKKELAKKIGCTIKTIYKRLKLYEK